MKDIFGNKKPVVIEIDEWWFNGRIIQKQTHPLLSRYISFQDNDNSCFVNTHSTKKEATEYCLANPVNHPDHHPKDYLG